MKIYLNEAQSGFVVCQSCGKSKKIEFAGGANFRSGIVKCTCGNTFAVTFEKREFYRKPIDSYGKCFATGGPAEGVSIKLVNVSRSGIRFIKIGGKPLHLNEKIGLSFSLDDFAILCSAFIYNIDTEGIGAKFKSLDEHIKKALGFFLLP